MTRIQEAIRSMVLKVLSTMDRNKEIWKDDPIITNSVNLILQLMELIKTDREKQNYPTTGATKDKKNARNKVNNNLDILYTTLRAYAKNTNNEKLFERVNVKISEIKHIYDSAIGDDMEWTMNYCTEHLKDLEPYGIREAGLKAMQTDLNDYYKIIAQPQDILAQRKTATVNLKQHFKDINDQLVNHLDNEMIKFRDSNPNFYQDYLNARVIYDAVTRHLSLHGIVTDEETKEVLSNVKVMFRHQTEAATADEKLPTTYTTDKGYYEFTSLMPGKGTTIYSKAYYDTLHMPIELEPNKDLKLNVALRKTE